LVHILKCLNSLWENVINDVTSEADRDDCFAWLKQQIDRTFVASDGPLTVLDVLAFFFINPSPKFFFLFFFAGGRMVCTVYTKALPHEYSKHQPGCLCPL